MAKGLDRGNREKKKPKATKKPAAGASTTVTQMQGKLTPPKTSGK